MDAMGYVFFARSAVSVDEDRHGRGSHERYVVVELACRFAFPFEIFLLWRGASFRRYRSFRGVAAFDGFLYLAQKDVGLERFCDIIFRAHLHGRHGGVYVGISGHDYQGARKAVLPHPVE